MGPSFLASISELLVKVETEDRKVHTTEPDLTEPGLFKPLEKSSELPIKYIALCIKICRIKLEKQ